MCEWQPDFIIDLGDFACQCADGHTTPQMHDCQLKWLRRHWALYRNVPFPAYIVIGNHDAGRIAGVGDKITPEDLCAHPHAGEDITEQEFLSVTEMPNTYFSLGLCTSLLWVPYVVRHAYDRPPLISRPKTGSTTAAWCTSR